MNFSAVKSVLSVSGLDPSGGAGLLVDCAAIRAAGCHPMGVVSVSTIQDGTRFIEARPTEVSNFETSLEAALGITDIGAIKIGALKSREIVETTARVLSRQNLPPIVIDPVMLSTTGGLLLDEDAVSAAKTSLFPEAALVTPNLNEAALLADMNVHTIDDMTRAAERILEMGPSAVLIKGGHLEGNTARDVLIDRKSEMKILRAFSKQPYEVRGTGCALSSLIAAWIARGETMLDAIEISRAMLDFAVRNARIIGKGPRVIGAFGTPPQP